MAKLTKRELQDLAKSNPGLLGKIQNLMRDSEELKQRKKKEEQDKKKKEREKKQQKREEIRRHKQLQKRTHKEWTGNEKEFKRAQKEQEKLARRDKPKTLFLDLKKQMYSGKLNVYSIKNTRGFKHTKNFLKKCKQPVLERLTFPRKVQLTYIVQFSKDGETLDLHHFKKKIEIWPSRESLDDNWEKLVVDHFEKEVFGFEGKGSGLSLVKISSLDINVYNYLDVDEDGAFQEN